MYLSILTLGVYALSALATPVPNDASSDVEKRTLSSSTSLRVLPLGASITVGYLSSQGYGYRKPLQDLLVAQSVNLDYVGSKQNGNMPNNRNEGKPGDTLASVMTRFTYSAAQRPNLVLIHAGTNDLGPDKGAAGWAAAPQLAEKLIVQVMTACPDATLLVAKLIHPKDPAFLQRVINFNNAVTAIINKYQAQGKHILNSDMTQISDLHTDGIHPTDFGYSQMANVWMASIKMADSKGWLTAPFNQYPAAKY